MSFLQLVFSLDKTFEGNNSILENMSILTDIATADTPPGKQTRAYGLRAAGTHPTGMHSCVQFLCFSDSTTLYQDFVWAAVSIECFPNSRTQQFRFLAL